MTEKGEKQNPKQTQGVQKKKVRTKEEIRESRIEGAFVKAVSKAGGQALKFTSQPMDGVSDRLVLFRIGKCAFVEMKTPGKQLRPLQKKRRKQLENLGFPVFFVDDYDQIAPVIQALKEWNPGGPFPQGFGAVIPEMGEGMLPEDAESKETAGFKDQQYC